MKLDHELGPVGGGHVGLRGDELGHDVDQLGGERDDARMRGQLGRASRQHGRVGQELLGHYEAEQFLAQLRIELGIARNRFPLARQRVQLSGSGLLR